MKRTKKNDETTLDTITTLYKIVYGANKYKTKLYARYKFNNKLIEESDERLKKKKQELASNTVHKLFRQNCAFDFLYLCVSGKNGKEEN